MWTVDDEIRDEISFLAKMNDKEPEWQERFATVVARAQEMIYKEANILFPNCAANFTEEEWIGIYQDQKDYAVCFGVEPEIWQKAEDNQYVPETSLTETEIRMPGGHLTIAQLIALLNTIPMEITFVDVDNINRFFNEGPKDFKRPGMAIDREVFSCHPPKIESTVRRIIGEFRAGALDEVPIWMDKMENACLSDTWRYGIKRESISAHWSSCRIWDLQRSIFNRKSGRRRYGKRRNGDIVSGEIACICGT